MVDKQLTIDVWRQLSEPITIVQHEAEGRALTIKLTSSGLPINVSAASVVFYAIKPDDNVIYNNCEIVDGAGGKVSYTITGQTCVLPGVLRCWIDVTAEDVKLRTQEFAITVQASVDSTGAVESTSEFTALETALAAVAGMTPTRSLEQDENGLHLVNDEAAPNDGEFYGIVGGIKGFYPAWHPGNLDCENGLWTPALIGSTSGEASYATQVGLYVKIGNLVHCSIRIVATVGTMIGDINLSGLPFVFGSMIYGGATMVALSGVTQTNATAAYIQPLSNQDYAWMRYVMSSSGALSFAANIAATDIGSQIELRGSLTYYS